MICHFSNHITSTLLVGFFVAFLSWFAFPPLIPEAIKSDLHLSGAQVANSNVIALSATLGIRIIVGPLVDLYGPRKVMAYLLILGAIPSGLAGTAYSAEALYVLRFFIGILGATFVPCQAWTSTFFDKNCVGTANALVGGWGRCSAFHRRGSCSLDWFIVSRKYGVSTNFKFLIASDVDEKHFFSGGATFAIMTTLFEALTHTYGLSAHVAWRAAFAIVP